MALAVLFQLYRESEGVMGRILNRGVILVLICLNGGTVAVAQRPPGGNPLMWQLGVGVLGNIKVRDELKLTADQMKKIQEIGDEYTEKMKPLSLIQKQLTPEEQQKRYAEFQKVQMEGAEKAAAVLTPEQTGRYRQILIWMAGPSAFSKPDVAKELDLTDGQKGALKTIGDEYEAALVKNAQPDISILKRINTQDGRDKAREDMLSRDKERVEMMATKVAECLAVLTDDQKARFEKLRGEKFEIRRELPSAAK